MPTTAAIALASPDETADSGFYVHYDGDDVGAQLRKLIERDGYPTVFATFRDQPSRFWRHLDLDTGDELPDFVSQFPQNIPRCQVVPGYGVLFIGREELQASAETTAVDPVNHMRRGYSVGSSGAVSIIR